MCITQITETFRGTLEKNFCFPLSYQGLLIEEPRTKIRFGSYLRNTFIYFNEKEMTMRMLIFKKLNQCFEEIRTLKAVNMLNLKLDLKG